LAFLVTGGTGSGKTTLLGALIGTIDHHERVVLIEDVAELVCDHPHLVRLVTRTVNVEGAGGVGMRELVRQALRMRPDRLIVGEFRGAETVDLLIALNTGHEGGAATVHANSAADVPARLAALGGLGGLDPAAVVALAASSVQVVIAVRREHRRRFVDEVAVLGEADGRLTITPAWRVRRGRGAGADVLAAMIARRGVAVPELLR
jgi:pilus assembly protein CpaF